MKISLAVTILTLSVFVNAHSYHRHGSESTDKYSKGKTGKTVEKYSLYSTNKKNKEAKKKVNSQKLKKLEKMEKLEKFEKKFQNSESLTVKKKKSNLEENTEISVIGSYDVPRHTNDCKFHLV